MPYARIKAPAKINLRLKVVGKRADGYHLLSMLNERLAFGDVLHIETSGSPEKYRDDLSVQVVCPNDPTLETQDNLVVKAARLLGRETGVATPVKITIEKTTPVAAGLGGGSSDAAATLIALNHLWSLYLPRTRLAELSLGLGADCPFFIYPTPSVVTGIGEIVNPLKSKVKLWVVLVNPGFAVATKEVYQGLGLGLTGQNVDDSFPTHFKDLAELVECIDNDLEKVVTKKYSAISEMEDFLRGRGALKAFMSGSGPTVVGLFETQAARDAALLGIDKTGWRYWATENL